MEVLVTGALCAAPNFNKNTIIDTASKVLLRYDVALLSVKIDIASQGVTERRESFSDLILEYSPFGIMHATVSLSDFARVRRGTTFRCVRYTRSQAYHLVVFQSQPICQERQEMGM